MGDLQCAARLFVARHGEAELETSDLAASLVGQRIARIWSSPAVRAVHTAEIAAARLGVDVVVREGLRESGAGESEAQVVDRFRSVLQEAADAHRGESVLVVSHGDAVCRAVPYLASNLRGDHALDALPAGCGLVELDVDADDWVARSWAGEVI